MRLFSGALFDTAKIGPPALRCVQSQYQKGEKMNMIPRTIHKKVTAGAGFVLVELIVAVAIIAVLCAVAIPSTVSINNSLTSKQADDYAKSIYMAAQNHLVNVRTNASLTTLARESEKLDNLISEQDSKNFPDGFANAPRYVSNGNPAQQDVFDAILPAGSIDATLRDSKILIEYSAKTGDVFSVFFLNEPASATDYLTYGTLVRDASRKNIHLGYYHGQANIEDYVEPTDPPVPEPLNCDTEMTNGMLGFDSESGTYGDAVVTVEVPVSSDYLSVGGCSMDTFRSNLSVNLTVTGKESGRSFNIDLSAGRVPSDNRLKCEFGSGNTLVYTYVLDSVARNLPFSGLSSSLIIGENVDLSASVSYNTPIQEVNLVNVSFDGNALLPNVNPLYDTLSGDTIQVANARQLQNLNCCAVSGIKNVNLAKSFSWYSDRDFAPLSNETLFGTDSRQGSVKSISGAGNTVSGLRFAGNGGRTGLFDCLSATVDQLTLDQVTVSGSCASAGAIAAKALAGAVIGNCSVKNLNMSLSPATDACVGGLVGEMAGGFLSGCSVSGSIDKDGGSTAYVGGAVGKDGSGAKYIDVAANVGLSDWGGSGTSAAPDDPSGLGVNVGKFIGYVSNGSFSNCSGTGDADKNYQFLGKVACSTATLAEDSYSCVSGDEALFSSADEDGVTYANLAAFAASKNMILVSKGSTYCSGYNATLENCTFRNNDTTSRQIITSKYFYLGEEGSGKAEITGASVNKITSLSRSNLNANRDTTRYIIYDITNNAILRIPDVDSNATSTYPSPVINSDGLLVTAEDSGSGCTKGCYGWGFNDFRMDGNMLFFAYSGGYNIRFAKGYFYDVSGGSMDIYQYGNGEFTFLDTYDSTYYLKFDPETRTYKVTKASSKSNPPADAPHFVLYEYKVSGLHAASGATESNTLVFNYTPLGYFLSRQSINDFFCTSEAVD